ncbi:type II toxin-antitoxin system HicA family toxin [Methyloglobulus sp.]|uniref:type II toxin-antitoxin system HicA family toxin n=1 Tax=Methyloglobulus sp. TaxID=2518622 RepID=UPI003988DBF1
MKGVSGKRFCRLLESNGWELKRINGSHHIYIKTGSIVSISVPIHGNAALKVGLQKHLMKVAGIDESSL